MGLVDDIEAAVADVADALPDAALEMRHGDALGVVVSSSSMDLNRSTVTPDAPEEKRRCVGKRADFPLLEQGSLVFLGEQQSAHIVVSARTDPVGASVSFGLSAPLDKMEAAYRRPGTNIRQSMNVLAVESDVIDPVPDGFAATASRAWFVAFADAEWSDVSEPQIGDELTIRDRTLRASAVARHDGCWILTCRARR